MKQQKFPGFSCLPHISKTEKLSTREADKPKTPSTNKINPPKPYSL